MKRRIFYIALFLFQLVLNAGDKAQFCAIGWSGDYNYFAFAQYGEQDGSGFPYAELYIVDIAQNDYVEGGVFKFLWNEETDPNAKGLNILLKLRVEADSMLSTFNIKDSNQVHSVFSPVDLISEKAQWIDESKKFSIQLIQDIQNDAENMKSRAAFHLILNYDNAATISLGNSKRFRNNVLRYDIDRILQSMDGKSIVIVIRMTTTGFEGPNIRYMVETIRLP